MAKYVIEIGLDGGIAPRNDGTFPHLMSLARVESWPPQAPPQGFGTPWWFTGFQSSDELVFRACDYTDYTKPAFKSSKLEVKGLYVAFLDPQEPKYLAVPVKKHLVATGQQYFAQSGWNSVVIPGAPGWRFIDTVNRHGNTEVVFPLSQFEEAFRALLRASVVATFTTPHPATDTEVAELRWFIHDPEIIVGVGGEGSYQSPRRRRSSPRRR